MKVILVVVTLTLLLSLNDIDTDQSVQLPEFRFNCETAKGIAEMQLYLEDSTIKAICATNN